MLRFTDPLVDVCYSEVLNMKCSVRKPQRGKQASVCLGKEAVDLGLKRRSGFDITRDILQACVNSATKTSIVFSANLNNKRTSRYLDYLLSMKLLVKEDNGRNVVYHTTPFGEDFLETNLKAA